MRAVDLNVLWRQYLDKGADVLWDEVKILLSERDAADAALAAIVGGDGVVVPKEPTIKMVDAALATGRQQWSINMIPKLERAYRAMLAVSPYASRS